MSTACWCEKVSSFTQIVKQEWSTLFLYFSSLFIYFLTIKCPVFLLDEKSNENDVDDKEKKGKSDDSFENEMFYNVMDKAKERERKNI